MNVLGINLEDIFVCLYCRSEPCRPRRGYMGHVTRIANQLVSRSTNDANLLNGVYWIGIVLFYVKLNSIVCCAI